MSGTANGSGQTFVDISGLAQLADELRQFTGQAMQGESQNARSAFSSGVPFGANSASGDVYVAKELYHENLLRVINTLDAYVAEGEDLSEKAREASKNYANADAAAASRTSGAGAGVSLAGAGAPAFIGPVAPAAGAPMAGPPAPATTAAAGSDDAEAFGDVAGWCTNWNAYDTQAIWQMVEPDNIDEGWTQVLAWKRVSEALNAQITSMADRQRQFADAWSAEAGLALHQRLGALIGHMGQTATAAASTATALEQINQVLSDTKQQLRTVKDEYDSKSTDLMLRQLDGAEDELNEQARQRMAAAEPEIRAASALMTPVPNFVVGDRGLDVTPPIGTGGTGAPPAAAIVPPVRHNPPAPLPGIEPVLPDGAQVVGAQSAGPELSGVSAPVAPQPTTGGLGSVPPANISPATGTTGLIGGTGLLGATGVAPVGAPRSGGQTARPVPVGQPPRAGGTRPASGGAVPPTAQRGVPTGGVIGATPPAAQSGRAAGGGASALRGGTPGVIGGTPGAAAGRQPGGTTAGTSSHGQRAGAGAVAGSAMPLGPGRGGPARDDHDATAPGLDPDNPWEVAEGVAPVIEPNRRRDRHDPGLGVIGMDR